MTNPDARGRRRAVVVAGHEGPVALARAGLGDGDAKVRAAALGALARLGHLEATDVAAALADGDPGVRRRACELAADHPEIDLGPALADHEPPVVEAAAWALGEQGRRAGPAVPSLVAVATGHPDPLCREAAVAALGAIGHPGGAPAVVAAAGSERVAVRRRAVVALAGLEGPAVEAALRAATADRDRQVRQAAGELLGEGPERSRRPVGPGPGGGAR